MKITIEFCWQHSTLFVKNHFTKLHFINHYTSRYVMFLVFFHHKKKCFMICHIYGLYDCNLVNEHSSGFFSLLYMLVLLRITLFHQKVSQKMKWSSDSSFALFFVCLCFCFGFVCFFLCFQLSLFCFRSTVDNLIQGAWSV